MPVVSPLPVSAVACLRCLCCAKLVLVHGDGHAACSGCQAVYVVAVRVEQAGTLAEKRKAG